MYFQSAHTRLKLFFTTIIFFSIFTAFPGHSQSPPAPDFAMSKENFTNSGYIKIEWDKGEGEKAFTYEIQQSEDEDFNEYEVLYKGRDRATFVSGLPNGIYFYRVRSIQDGQTSAWSEVIKVEVEHHSLSLAFSLAGLGLVVFLLTVYIIVHGVRKQNETA